ncbi:30S ribosomal protein S9 [Candidatus Microgenomates bacterium]|nr:30S ribosomal protein S9 [Candidatus Microgenomates bacterium]
MAKQTKKDYIYAVGRRRESSARVRLHKGKDQSMVNDQPIGQYFAGAIAMASWNKPFELTQLAGKYFVTVKVAGGGKNGQLGAVVLGTARAIEKLDPEKYRPALKKAGLLTRDSRIRERRKINTGGKARRKKQSPKR